MSVPALQTLVERPHDLWGDAPRPLLATVTTGYPTLDARLPGQGWPIGALTELVVHNEGFGEVQLLLPALRRITRSQRDVLLIQPPYLPYAPALAKARLCLKHVCWINTKDDEEARWIAEKSLRDDAVGAVVVWSSTLVDSAMRRLHEAARYGNALSFIYRPVEALDTPSNVSLRLSLWPGIGGALKAELLNVQGEHSGELTLSYRAAVSA